jgi:DNA invertase Pin-like site-specific DNA recombinase
MKIGYARVSTADQNLDLQFNALTEYGCTTIYQEKISGKNTDRPELKSLLATQYILICSQNDLNR